jgi:spermidine/putrescine transport system ATP-binding protein
MAGGTSQTLDPSRDIIVSLRGVEKRFGGFIALHDLNLDVRRGEFLTLLGPSGCGKTTTLRLINGFELPSRGTVQIGGADVSAVPPFRRNVNTVFQSYALFPHLTVRDNIAYGLTVKRLPRSEIRCRVAEMLELVGLEDKAGSFPRELSGGQMQRVALARALINEPAVLLLDEPLGALDAKLRRSMQIELRRMQRDLQVTAVCVTHDQEEALTMSDRIAVMNAGELIQVGTPQEIFENPRSDFVADFVGGCNFLPAIASGSNLLLGDGIRVPGQANQPAGPVTLAIRPHNLRLAPAGEGSAGIPAQVRDVAYVGSTRRVLLIGPGGAEIHAEMAAGSTEPTAGQNVKLLFDPSAAVVFGGRRPSDQP